MKRQTKHAYLYPVKVPGIIKAESMIVWSVPIVFCLHLLDETLLNGGFVTGVQQHIWSAYNYIKVERHSVRSKALVSAAGLIFEVLLISTLFIFR
jgi:hypothetical protein